jgi:hypothetical protein
MTTTAIRVYGVPGLVDHADPSRRVAFGDRLGDCYLLAAQYVMCAQQTMLLVHGTIQSHAAEIPLEHAWVELPDTGAVFEPTSGHQMTRDRFDGYFHPVARVRYSEDEAWSLLAETMIYGPWEEEKEVVPR